MPSTLPDTLISRSNPLFDYLKKQQDNQRFIQTLEIGITFAFISLFAWFAIRPAIITISGLVGDIKSKELMVQKMRSKINDIVVAQDNFSQIQERYSIVESAIPDHPAYSHLATQILGVSSQSNTTLPKFEYHLQPQSGDDKKTTNQQLQTYDLNLNTQMSFASGLSFLSNLARNRRLHQISALTITNPKSKDQSTLPAPFSGLSWDLDISAYYWDSSADNVKK
jgi:hypothetical protein